MDYLIRLQRLDLSCVFAVSSLPITVVEGSKSFSFPGCYLVRIVSSTITGGRSSKDPVTYRARKAILETMIRLP